MANEQTNLDFDFRNNSRVEQAVIIDTFFQNNNIEKWDIGEDETITIDYDAGVTTNPTRFTFIDFGVNGVKSDIAAANANAAYNTLVAENAIVKKQKLGRRILAIQYRITPVSIAEIFRNQRVPEAEIEAIVGDSTFAEIAVVTLGTPQTDLEADVFVKINQFIVSVRSKNMTIDQVNNSIKCLVEGSFKINASFTFQGSNNRLYEAAVFVNGFKVPHVAQLQQTGSSTDSQIMSFDGGVVLLAGDDVDIRIAPDQANSEFSIPRGNFSIDKVR